MYIYFQCPIILKLFLVIWFRTGSFYGILKASLPGQTTYSVDLPFPFTLSPQLLPTILDSPMFF